LTVTGSKIADFGIARVPDSTLTREGSLLGTPAYSSPESIASGKFSPLSDQFSFAATLYEAVSGQRAFPGEDAVSVASRITTDEPPPIAKHAGVDAHVDVVLARGLTKDPAGRFESARALGQALAEALVHSPRSKLPTLPDERHREPDGDGNRRTLRIAITSAVAGALLGAAAVQLSVALREPDHDPVERSSSVGEHTLKPIGFLSESPKPKAKAPTAHHDGARDERGRDAGADPARRRANPADAGSAAVTDAGRPAEPEP
jgi:serine/threonine protein kinase